MVWVPLESVFEPPSSKYTPFLVLGLVDMNSEHCGPFRAVFGPFLGPIAGLDGFKGLFVTRKSSRTYLFPFVWPF